MLHHCTRLHTFNTCLCFDSSHKTCFFFSNIVILKFQLRCGPKAFVELKIKCCYSGTICIKSSDIYLRLSPFHCHCRYSRSPGKPRPRNRSCRRLSNEVALKYPICRRNASSFSCRSCLWICSDLLLQHRKECLSRCPKMETTF